MKLSIILFVLIFGALINICNGFATSKVFAAVLSFFGDTKFHDTQTVTALCITQYNFLRRNQNFQYPAPARYESCPYYDWEKNMTNPIKAAVDWAHLETIKDTFATAVDYPDLGSMYPIDHFDLESYIIKTNVQIIQLRTNLINNLKDPIIPLEESRIVLGRILHTVQDFYAHTNWVELGNNEINLNVGKSDLGIDINDGVACKACSHNFTTNEEKAINDAYSGNASRVVLNKLGKRQNIYSCINNLATNKLTSGYYAEEANYAPSGTLPADKCSRGGLTDDFATLSPTGGINKDADTVLLSPHYYLHQKAADMSVQATIQYFEDLRISIDDEKLFGELIGFDAASNMAILIDTTGSMANSIKAVKQFAQEMVLDAANKTSKFFMTPFNDPTWGPVNSFTNAQDMVNYISTLTADGGDDTPEKCFRALLDTVRAVPQGTNIFIFTDANSKDAELYPTIVALANQKGVHISFMMSGENVSLMKSQANNFVKAPKVPIPVTSHAATTSIENYRRLTIATDGQYLLSHHIATDNLTAAITDTHWRPLSILTNIRKPTNRTFYIDNTITLVEISLSASYPLDSTRYDIVDANGKSVISKSNVLVKNSYSVILRFEVFGHALSPWTLEIISISSLINQITVRVQSSLTANLLLVNTKTQKPLIGSPLVGQAYDIYVICERCSTITAFGYSSCGIDAPMLSQTPTKTTNMTWWSVTNISLPYYSTDNQICISFMGEVSNGSVFTRVAQQKLVMSSLKLDAQILTGNLTGGQVYPNDNVIINYTVSNLGSVNDSFTTSVTSSFPFSINYDSGPIFVRYNNSVTKQISIIANGSIGTVSTVELSISSTLNSAQYNLADFTIFVINPNPDIFAPICTVANSTVSSCPINPSQCATAKYDATLAFFDVGTGVVRISYNNGTWNVTDTNLFNTSSASNHTFYAFGSISCCDNTHFSIIDGASLVGQCNVDVLYPTTTQMPTTTLPNINPLSNAIGTSCSTNSLNAWLDIYFIIDVSKGMIGSDLVSLGGQLATLYEGFTIGQTPKHSTRVGIITYASTATIQLNLTACTSPEVLQNVVFNLVNYTLPDDDGTNIKSGLQIALSLKQAEKSYRRMAVVVIAAAYNPETAEDPTQVAQLMKQDSITILTVAFGSSGALNTQLGNLSSPGYVYNNTDPELFDKMLFGFTQINCFCPPKTYQFKIYNEAFNNFTTFSDCIYGYSGVTDPAFANRGCQGSGGVLTSVTSKRKLDYIIDNVVQATMNNTKQFTVGAHEVNSTWYWYGYNNTIYPVGDWPENPSNVLGSYSYFKNTFGFNWVFLTQDKGYKNSKPYVCQSKACDADFLCNVNAHSF